MTIANVSGGELIDPAWGNAVANQLNAAAFTDFVPSIAGLTIGNGTYVAKYCYLAPQLLYVYVSINFGSTTSISGNTQLTLPDSAQRDPDLPVANVGGAAFNDSGSTTYLGMVRTSTSTTVVDVLAYNSGGTYVQRSTLSATVPMTWTTGDQLSFYALVPLA